MITTEEFAELLKNEKSVALFCHVRPDGDTVGSALALKMALEGIGIESDVYSTDSVRERYSYIKGYDSVKQVLEKEYTAFVAIDNAEPTRLGVFYDNFLKHKNTYNLDHHVSNTRYGKNYLVIDRAANAENVLELINRMGIEITPNIANALLTGIVTDTGNFRHKNVTAETLMHASALVKAGGDLNMIVYKTFTEQTMGRAKLFGKVMSKLRYFYSDRFAVATVFLNDLKECGARQEETEGFIDFVMGINTVKVGACVMETENGKYKISLRSKGINVNAIAGAFGGGGHILASGCQLSGDYEEVIDRLSFEVSKYIDD